MFEKLKNKCSRSLTKKIFIVGILFLSLCFLKFYHHSHVAEHVVSKIYDPAPITVALDWEIEKPFELQIYYTSEQNERFHGRQSVKKKVTPKDKHVEVVLPVEKIYKFRIDFGSNPGKVRLKNVEIKADQYINFNDWLSYVYVHIERYKVDKDDNSLKIISHHQDPFMYWADPFVLYKKER